MAVRTIDDIFRDFVIDGVPSSGPHHPYKPDIRDTLKKLLEGISTFPDNRVIRLNNANTGTANNIIVSASVDIPVAAYQVLYVLNVTQENTGPVTVSGAINRTLVTNTSEPVPAGYLTPGMAVLCIDTGTELRMLSYGDAEAIQAAAEEAANRAEDAAAGLNLPVIQAGDAGKLLIVNDDEDGYKLGSSTAGECESRAKVQQVIVPDTVNFLRTAGYYVAGDGGGALYKRAASEPSHAGKVKSADGAWWELYYANGINVLQVGIVGDGITDVSGILNNLPVCDVVFPYGSYVAGDYSPHDGIEIKGMLGTILTLKSGAGGILSLRTDASDITFKGISFIGNAGVSDPAIRLIGKPTRNNIVIDNCYFSTFGGMAIAFGGLKQAKIKNCYFTNTALMNNPSGTASLPAIWLSGDDGVSDFDDCRDIEITGCMFSDLYWSAIYSLGTRINIHSNTFKGTRESSVFMSHLSRYITVMGNVFDTTVMQNISASAIEMGGAYLTIVGNTIRSSGLYGISLQDCQFFNVSGNTLSFNQTGIAIFTSSPSNPPRYGSVVGNTITNSTQYGLRIIKVGSGGIINDCKFSGNNIVASALADFSMSHATGVVSAATDINFNHALDSSPSTGSVNMQPFATAAGVVVRTYSFRPKSISIMAVQPGGEVRQSLGEVIFDPTGTVVQRYTRINGTSCTFGSDLAISIENIFTATVTGVRFNTTTNLWEVLANTVRSQDVAVWAVWTAQP